MISFNSPMGASRCPRGATEIGMNAVNSSSCKNRKHHIPYIMGMGPKHEVHMLADQGPVSRSVLEIAF